MNAWLNLVKVPIKARMLSMPSLEGSTFVKSIDYRSSSVFSFIECVFYLYNYPLWSGTMDNFSHIHYILEQGVPIKSFTA